MTEALSRPPAPSAAVSLRVLLTGAAGRLGSVVRPVLRQAGHVLVPTDIQGDPNDPELRPINLLDPAAAHEAMVGCDAIVHLGNHPSQRSRPPAQLFNENVTMTMNVFSAARTLGIRRILYASSIQVIASEWLDGYSQRPPRIAYLPLDGHAPADPTNSYALSKRVGEITLAQWATELPLEAAALRFPLLWHPGQPLPLPRHAGAGPRAPSLATIAQGFSWLSFRDAAELIAALLVAPLRGAPIYLPASPTPRGAGSVAELLEKHYRDTPRRPGHTGPLAALIDISELTRDSGWAPRDLTF